MKRPDWLPIELETSFLTSSTINVQIKELQKQLQDLINKKNILESEQWKSYSRLKSEKEINLSLINQIKVAIDRGEYEIESTKEEDNLILTAKIEVKNTVSHPLDR